ncbi:hypothetical protein GE21DRAFT_1279984 [Neurospora crassa]|nr:hypothetical protein GE21DRAFT_1279984 [Neurospora crassa]
MPLRKFTVTIPGKADVLGRLPLPCKTDTVPTESLPQYTGKTAVRHGEENHCDRFWISSKVR